MGRITRCLLVGLSAIFGSITLAVALWLLVLLDPHTVLQSCSTGSGGTRVQECTPLSTGGAWPWLSLLSGLLGAVAGGFGVDRLTRRRRTLSDWVPPPRQPSETDALPAFRGQ